MKQLVLVFIGGGFGSCLRYLLGKYLNVAQTGIPYGTFAANILGSLIIGFILGLAAKHQTLSQNQLLLIATGFCGGFTTFSTFAYENHAFLKNGDLLNFILYASITFILGIIAVFLGVWLIRFI
ncbi:fluoride efflux transporter CrcB [Galbibacter mesophilus]|uniref:fluoride efflux transporter CrcB n=1 Tax=Galbibacter mesophilus TaxID=379069 RepID=UPI00191C9911|nr:fluoride efflux transporter CrcB [Galbibacter mesophilus]MCM5663966.1 fluoride efflux transporter CrcB [Galbibacter mesophilus]